MKKLMLAIVFLSATGLLMAQNAKTTTQAATSVNSQVVITPSAAATVTPQKAATATNGGEVQVGAGTPRSGVKVPPRPKKDPALTPAATRVRQ